MAPMAGGRFLDVSSRLLLQPILWRASTVTRASRCLYLVLIRGMARPYALVKATVFYAYDSQGPINTRPLLGIAK